MKKILYLLLFLPVPFITVQSADQANIHLLRETTIKVVELKKASLEDAVAFIRTQTKQEKTSLNIVIDPEALKTSKTVTLDLRGVTAEDVLVMIMQQTNTRAEIRRNMLWIVPRKE